MGTLFGGGASVGQPASPELKELELYGGVVTAAPSPRLRSPTNCPALPLSLLAGQFARQEQFSVLSYAGRLGRPYYF